MSVEDSLKLIQNEKPEITDGRGEAIGPFILEIFKSKKFGNDP